MPTYTLSVVFNGDIAIVFLIQVAGFLSLHVSYILLLQSVFTDLTQCVKSCRFFSLSWYWSAFSVDILFNFLLLADCLNKILHKKENVHAAFFSFRVKQLSSRICMHTHCFQTRTSMILLPWRGKRYSILFICIDLYSFKWYLFMLWWLSLEVQRFAENKNNANTNNQDDCGFTTSRLIFYCWHVEVTKTNFVLEICCHFHGRHAEEETEYLWRHYSHYDVLLKFSILMLELLLWMRGSKREVLFVF